MLDSTLIRRADLLARVICFDGMNRIRNITPTDIDAIMDYGGNAWWIAECKFAGNKMKHGQRVALERIADKLPNCLLFVCEHHNAEGQILLKDCIVTERYWRKKWSAPGSKVTVLETVESFEKMLMKQNIEL